MNLKFLTVYIFANSFLVLCSLAQVHHKTVSIVLDSKWHNTPLHLEASEFLAEESPDLFWKFVDNFSAEQCKGFYTRTAKEQYDSVISSVSNYLTSLKLSLLKFSLSLRAYSPTIEAFHQIANDQQLPNDCDVIVDVGGVFACSADQVERLLNTGLKNKLTTYKLDHHYQSSSKQEISVILYGDICSPDFHEIYLLLKEKNSQKNLNFALRHYVKKRSNTKVRLSGYGVELAVKSTEYKAQDDTKVKEETTVEQDDVEKLDEVEGFVFSKLKELHVSKKNELEELKIHLLDSQKEIPTLKIWELQELSLQTAQRIVDSPIEEALRLMRDISQNFPVQARSLIRVAVDAQLKKEIDRNQQMFLHHHNLAPADAAIFFNGMFFDMESTDVFTLLQFLKQDTKVLEGLHKIGITNEKALKLLKTDFAQEKQDYAVDIRDSAIQYINDLETDRPYKNWPNSVQDLLRPTYPGMLRSIKKNIYHLVIVADPSESMSKDIFKLAESFFVHKAPVRIGIVFSCTPDATATGFKNAGVALLEAFNFIKQEKTAYDGLSFITDVYATSDEKDISAEIVINHFKSKYATEDLELIFGTDSDYDTGRKLAWDFINRTGIGTPPQVLLNGVILKQVRLNADMFEEAILNEIMKQTPFLQKSVYKGELSDSHNVLDFLMDQKNVMPRLNQRILSSESVYFDLTIPVKDIPKQTNFRSVDEKELFGALISSLKYLSKRDEEAIRPLTLWIVTDLETTKGRSLLSSALSHLKSSNKMRLCIVHNPSTENKEKELLFTKLIQTSLDVLDLHTAKLFITKLVKENNAKQLESKEKLFSDFAISNMNIDAFSAALSKFENNILDLHSAASIRSFKLGSGESAVICNGKLIGPFNEFEEFTEDDFNLLEKYSLSQFGEKLSTELNEEDSNGASDMAMKAASVLLAQSQTKVRHELKFHDDKHSVIKIPSFDLDQPAHELVAILDPASKGAQKLTPLLMVLQKVINVNIKVFLNCVDKHSGMPLKSFYRFVLESELQFTPSGDFTMGPLAKFTGLPSSPLLTLAMATPENWLVEVVRSPYDLDNIHLEQVDSAVHADFELEHLLIEGHSFEQSTGNPPRGMQFTLGTNTTPVVVDTIVMANLGYFQLKANPGAWLLRLRQGRSSEIYDIVGHDNTDSPTDSSDVVIILSSFKSHIIKVRVSKKPGKQYDELLYDEAEDSSGLWNTITSMPIIGGIIDEWTTIYYALKSTFSRDQKDGKDIDDKINIFSLASGHLYERLLRIMMLSVLKNTQTPVKFWFLKNYLSPTFKDFLPYMAKKYGFEYELVQYKWPRWLNQQSEKQRIIWGYKILFLDVLFPLDVKKIIFVDADQIVRADMRELRDLDLGGAPYGYTPFCESRKDMDGYRFWKSGYWASHLAGRKYHISALYVVDLMKFRRIAAGDRLRGQYQGLSQDPNSLSNLDQDLPNNMIHQVAIKSLPQEWLWCETWCDDASKQSAKTIDLCNNPKTKEPKLVGAVRLIPEWNDYDTEIKKLFENYEIHKNSVILEEEKDHTDYHKEL